MFQLRRSVCRPSYEKVLPSEPKATTVGSLARAAIAVALQKVNKPCTFTPLKGGCALIRVKSQGVEA